MIVIAFRNKEKEQKKPSLSQIEIWTEAKLITSAEGDRCPNLPLGWYLYKKGYLWYTLKPNSDRDGFEREYDFHTAREAQTWLGIQVPQELIREEESRVSAKDQIARVQAMAGKQAETRQLQEQPVREKPPEKRPCTRKRSVGVYFQLTPEEHARFKKRVTESRMGQTEFIALSVLHNEIVLDESKEELIRQLRLMNDTLQSMRGELGKHGGMLKMMIRPNEEQKTMNPADWDYFIKFLHNIEYMKKRTITVSYGTRNSWRKRQSEKNCGI